MRQIGRLSTALVASFVAFILLFSAPVMAAEAGTHAWSTKTLVLRAGPGREYQPTGNHIQADVAIKVLRCQTIWCNVEGPGGRGWTAKHAIDFGLGPNTAVYRTPGPRQVCFYQGANYTGKEYCFGAGVVVKDLALLGLDNAFSSVKLSGGANVAVCRDRFFQSYCERVITPQPVLDQYLRGALSSIQVY
ncbi:peptidase inhibitor family I36 protein [Devosia sp. 2618]|uniref:peptidase inhibitor family I36 protein n=1 Tax=Devosia sp. 2618 TaxID=3156454 RepID=UPI0033986C9E